MMVMMINDDPFFIHLLQDSFVQTSFPFPFFPARICFPSASPQSSSGSESPQVWGLFPFSSGSSEPGDGKCTLEPNPKFPVEFHILIFFFFYPILFYFILSNSLDNRLQVIPSRGITVPSLPEEVSGPSRNPTFRGLREEREPCVCIRVCSWRMEQPRLPRRHPGEIHPWMCWNGTIGVALMAKGVPGVGWRA